MYSMAYFSHGDARQKLMLLFFLDSIDFELTRSQFYRIFFENGWMDYFDFQARLTELEEDGHVAALPLAFGHGYRVTPQGQQTLAMFQEELPHSLREKLSECARQNRDILRSEAQFYARQTQLPDGGYHATLRLMVQARPHTRYFFAAPHRAARAGTLATRGRSRPRASIRNCSSASSRQPPRATGNSLRTAILTIIGRSRPNNQYAIRRPPDTVFVPTDMH